MVQNKQQKNITLTSSPHVRSSSSTSKIMRDVIIALLPATAAGIYFFGILALWVVLLSVGSAVLTEALIQKATKKRVTINDLSAALTGLLLALNVPPGVPLWIPVIGSAFAIAITKQIFGGLGQNFINPALAARIFLVASWPEAMKTWIIPNVDAVSTATPMALLKSGAVVDAPSYLDMAIGNIGGCIGETSAIALVIGGIYLLIRRVISWRIPLTYLLTVALFTFIAGPNGVFSGDVLYNMLGGGLMLGAIFMATDYATSPISNSGKIIFGVGCGLLTSIIRIFGGYAEGVAFSILIMNLVVPLIDRAIKPKVFGEVLIK